MWKDDREFCRVEEKALPVEKMAKAPMHDGTDGTLGNHRELCTGTEARVRGRQTTRRRGRGVDQATQGPVLAFTSNAARSH